MKNRKSNNLSRRNFLTASAISSASLMLGITKKANAKKTKKPKWLKSLILKEANEEQMTKIKAAGFDGIEADSPTPACAEKIKKAAQNTGLKVHSVLHGWASFNSPDFAQVNKSLTQTADSLRAAQILKADNILLVPGRIDTKPIPQPWLFNVKFDKSTGYITSVTDEKDQTPYKDYIAAHNKSYDAFQAAILKLIPTAKKTGVIITIENVWNNLFINPEHLAYFIDSFNSKWVQVYFDIGNHVKYSPPQQWIKTLGKRIVKCHVKDFKLNPNGQGGKFVNIREGSVNWPATINTLEQNTRKGWLTIEGSGNLTLQEQSKRLDLIIQKKIK